MAEKLTFNQVEEQQDTYPKTSPTVLVKRSDGTIQTAALKKDINGLYVSFVDPMSGGPAYKYVQPESISDVRQEQLASELAGVEEVAKDEAEGYEGGYEGSPTDPVTAKAIGGGALALAEVIPSSVSKEEVSDPPLVGEKISPDHPDAVVERGFEEIAELLGGPPDAVTSEALEDIVRRMDVAWRQQLPQQQAAVAGYMRELARIVNGVDAIDASAVDQLRRLLQEASK